MDRIVFTYWFATVICIGIFALVAGVIVYAVWTFRVQPDDDTDGPPIHGHTGLEIAWTVVPAILVIAIGVVSAVVLSQNADAGPHPLKVRVFAQQFAWRFVYEGAEGGEVRSNELVMPLDRAVEFEMSSADVIHSLWIPEMGQKQDVVPGVTTDIVITPTRTGRFTLICTELCGLGHATMRAPVRVLSQDAFDTWLDAEPAARWVTLARAWLASTRLPGLVGGRAADDKPWNALTPELSSVLMPETRAMTLAALAEVPSGHALASGTGLPSASCTRARHPGTGTPVVPGRTASSAAEMKMCSSSVAPMPLMIRSPVRSCQARQVASGRFSPADTHRLSDEMSYGFDPPAPSGAADPFSSPSIAR